MNPSDHAVEKATEAAEAIERSRLESEKRIIAALEQRVAESIQSTVNGKIDKLRDILVKQNESMGAFHDKVEAHIKRVEPVIESFEQTAAFNLKVTNYGKGVIFWGKIVGSLGVIALAAKAFLFNK